jgi:hypothetical protein
VVSPLPKRFGERTAFSDATFEVAPRRCSGSWVQWLSVAIIFAVALLVIDLRALDIVSRMFDREHLVTGSRAARP